MEIQFLGGAGEVGRSAFLLKDEKNLLLDYGVKVGTVKPEYPLVPGRVDACIVSHAHFDHSGALPTLYNHSLPVAFGTRPTLEFSELLIEDSLGISQKQHTGPAFTKGQIKSFVNKFVSYDYHVPLDFSNYEITFYDAGHIFGSAITLIENKRNGRRLVYTGDFKIAHQELQGSAEIVSSDILMVESTYATRSHPDRATTTKAFIEDVRETLDNGGVALVPCFAVGRAQEILAILYRHNLIDQTYLDGMAKKATDIALRHPEFVKDKQLLMSAMKNVTWIEDHHGRTTALDGPGIIVTTAGMLNGGPALHYVTRLSAQSKVMLTGYQVAGTNGRKLLDGRPLEIDNETRKIKNPAAYYDFSAHASMEDIYEYVRKSNPETVICIHGDAENTESLAENLKKEGFDAYAPKLGDKLITQF